MSEIFQKTSNAIRFWAPAFHLLEFSEYLPHNAALCGNLGAPASEFSVAAPCYISFPFCSRDHTHH
jgi:hypothetical protein